MGIHKTKIGFFTVPEYEKEEQWLRKNHNEGWKLVGITFPCFYHFVKCEPEDVIYQLDYNKSGRDNRVEYLLMFSDCDWDHITDFVGYSYFSKPVKAMNPGGERIFNDPESKLDMSLRVFKGRMIPLIIIFFTLILPQLFMQHSMGYKPLFYLYCALCAVYIILFAKFAYQYFSLKQRTIK